MKFKSRTSVRVWNHCSDASRSCPDFWNSMDVKVRYYFQLIFALCQGSHKYGKCSPESKGTPLVEGMLILSKMYRGITHTQLKWTAVLQTKILPETWFDPQGTETTELAAINCSISTQLESERYKTSENFVSLQLELEFCQTHCMSRKKLNTWKSLWQV